MSKKKKKKKRTFRSFCGFRVDVETSHRFWSHPSATESLVFYAWPDPCKDVDHILDINFLRNAVGYLGDCEREGLKPSVFQVILFYQHASSIWTPPFLNWVHASILNVVQYVVAYWVAVGVLGYVFSDLSDPLDRF